MIYYSWYDVEDICPIDISQIVKFGQSVNAVVDNRIDVSKLTEWKQRLIMASGDLETLILNLIELISNTDKMYKTDLDRAIFNVLKEDFSRYIHFIDKKQSELLEFHDGESLSGISRTTAFRKEIKTAVDLIYYTLLNASKEYNKLEDKEKELRVFLRILFLMLSAKLSISGGIQKQDIKKKTFLPSNYKESYTQEGTEQLKKEIKEKIGVDVKKNDKDLLDFSNLEDKDDD